MTILPTDGPYEPWRLRIAGRRAEFYWSMSQLCKDIANRTQQPAPPQATLRGFLRGETLHLKGPMRTQLRAYLQKVGLSDSLDG